MIIHLRIGIVVEDKDLPAGVKIDYKSIEVDGKTVPVKKKVEKNASEIYMVKTSCGFKIVYPELSGKSTITFQSKVTSQKLFGNTVKNVATAISDQTPLKKDSAKVKIPKNTSSSPSSVVKTGDS